MMNNLKAYHNLSSSIQDMGGEGLVQERIQVGGGGGSLGSKDPPLAPSNE